MSDPELTQPEQPADVNDVVDSAREGLDAAAAAAAADVPNTEPAAEAVVDPDLAAFDEAEQSFPGTFATSAPAEVLEPSEATGYVPGADAYEATPAEPYSFPADNSVPHAEAEPAFDAPAADFSYADATAATVVAPSVADTAYAPPVPNEADTVIVASEPVVNQVQPIFVQAPEAPRERGNRLTAAGIGLLAAVAFGILYLATSLIIGLIAGDVTLESIGTGALAELTTPGFWVPVVVFFFGFWLLGAIINRGRWGFWVLFGLFAGVFAYGGHVLGQLFEAPFWMLTASEGAALVGAELLSPLAIAAFVFGRELTIWFGAWVARSGARKTELNVEAQREYERTLEAGPVLPR